MDTNQHNLFKTLIDKLQLSDSQKCFQNGLINELIIHNQSNRWSFYFTLNSIMPYQIFKKFDSELKKLFKDVSFIGTTFKVKNSKVTDDLIKSYWPWVVKNCGLSTIMTQQLTAYGHLKVGNNRISLSTKNEALRGFLINGALVQIEDCYHRLGFPRFVIHVLGGKTKLPAKIIDFKIEKDNDDIKLARRAVKALDYDSSND